MTETTLAVQFAVTPQVLYRAQRALMHNVTSMRRAGIFVVVIFPLAMIGIQLMAGQSLQSAIMSNLAWIVGFPAFWLLGIPLLLRWSARRMFRSTPVLQQQRLYTFGPNGMTLEAGLSRGELQWPAIVRVVETDDLVLLFYNKKVAHFLPKEAFASAAELAQFRALVAKAIGNRAQWAGDAMVSVAAP